MQSMFQQDSLNFLESVYAFPPTRRFLLPTCFWPLAGQTTTIYLKYVQTA